jgi:flagellar hook-basal body complex protein FliE
LRGPAAASLRTLFDEQARRAATPSPATQPGGGIGSIGSSGGVGGIGGAGSGASTVGGVGGAAGPSFTDSLVRAIQQANEVQLQADEMSRALAAGQAAELHSVMLAAEKANLALQFTLQVRNKVIEAYQEIMRVQV